MKIAVCVKQSIDTEALITLGSDGEGSTEGAALIIDPYAEFAVEKAVQLKEQNGGEVILVTVGSQDEVPAIRHALSMGCLLYTSGQLGRRFRSIWSGSR